ncbi:MAG: S8 family serine peptidase [Ginsengibacter sp.]
MNFFFKTIFVCFFLLPCCIFAQHNPGAVRFRNGDLLPEHNVAKNSFSKASMQSSLFDKKYFVVISFDNLPGAGIKKQLAQKGIQLLRYIPSNAYLGVIDEKFTLTSVANAGINGINPLKPQYKIDKAITGGAIFSTNNSPVIAISYYPGIERKIVVENLVKLNAIIVKTKFDKDGLIFIKSSVPGLDVIARLPFVIYISLQTIKDSPLNYNSNAAHGNNALSYEGFGGRALTGKDVTLGMGDNANVTSHLDFTGRVINRTPSTYQLHGTHTTCTAAGAGIINQKYKGMAPGATIVSQYFSDIIVNAPTYLADNNLTLTNNSYYSSANGCEGNSVYDELSNYIDALSVNNDKILHVVAAGNDGALSCNLYPTSFATIKSGWQCAKNVLTVGAIDNATNTIASLSSRGPVEDGRIKPEIVAGGANVISAFMYNGYGSSSGTSMAAPAVTGSLALMTQRYKQLNGNSNPPAFLLKGLLCNSAIDVGNKGPDFTYGFGRLNTRKAVEDLEANNYFINTIYNSNVVQQVVNVPPGTAQFKVLLYWPDKESIANSALTLVNDLDLSVAAPTSAIHLPFVLNSSPEGINENAIEAADHLNNIEQVVIENPLPGNYTINISGYSVPFGPQPYVLAYEINKTSVMLEYPFGGEKWVPGETETIRWDAFDADTDPFTIEYSGDNGGSWITIDDNVPAAQRLYPWTVPSLPSNSALIRISRNNTTHTAHSFNFSVLGQPVVGITNPCDGYLQLDWSVVPGATAYDVYMLTKDSMQVMSTTNLNTYLLKGLDSNKKVWIAVAAKNGAIKGRRSVAAGTQPVGGACTLSAFDNDLKAIAILEPFSGREFTSTSIQPVKPVKVQIKNLDDVPSTGPFDISYRINGSAPVTENVNTTITAGGTYTHTFAQQTILPGPFADTIKVWVTKGSDNQHDNDTAFRVVKLLANPVISLPFNEGFETAGDDEYTTNTTGLNGLDNFDFVSNSVKGRARTFVNTGFTHSGNKALTLDQVAINSSYSADSLVLTSNLSSYSVSSDQLRLDFFYKNSGQDNLPGNKVWIRGSDTSVWLPAFDLYSNQANIGQYKEARAININNIFSAAVPPQNVTGSFQVKFGEQGITSSNSPHPIIDLDDGYTFDDIKISRALNDISVTKIIAPSSTGCGLGAATSISITVKNYSNLLLNNIQVGYRINNNTPVFETIPVLHGNESLNFTFATPADMSAFIDYNVDVWVNYLSDNYPNNDSIIDYTLHNSPLVTSYPYLEGFEANDGNWYTRGANSSWEWGVPAKAIINKAANGSKAWVTGLTENYNDNELSYLYSPCFDLSSLAHPMLSFSHIHRLEDECSCDFHWVEYSTDGGLSWHKLGSSGTGTNWYDDVLHQRWQLSKPKWEVSSIDIPSNSSIVRFRFVMGSDEGGNYEGVGIDDIHVFDKAGIYSGPDASVVPQIVNGSGWVDFNIAGKKVVSINANGQNLGLTSVKVYFNNGPVRTSNNQYYLDRNIVVQPSVQPVTDVSVRYFFTDAEAQLLVNATGCPSCSTIKDAYESGVTKFSGNTAEENGTLADNHTGFYKFLTPANVGILPYDNGYYGQFNVTSFSEFWIDSGGPGGISPLPITLSDFQAKKDNDEAILTWSTVREFNSDKFIVERSGNGIDFIAIGGLPAKGTTNTENTYEFPDALTLSGINYYRLKSLDKTGNFSYSIIRQLSFDKNSLGITIFPNPVINGKLTVKTSEECRQMELLNMSGQRLKVFPAQGSFNKIDVGNLPAGIYQIKIFTVGTTQTVKINIQ